MTLVQAQRLLDHMVRAQDACGDYQTEAQREGLLRQAAVVAELIPSNASLLVEPDGTLTIKEEAP